LKALRDRMADLDILLDYPGAEYALAKAFSCDEFLCKVQSKSEMHNPGDGNGLRNRVEVQFEWILDLERVGHGWAIIDEADTSVVQFQGLYIEKEHQGQGIFTSVVRALGVWHTIGVREGRIGGTPTSAPMFERHGFKTCDRPIMAGGVPLAIYSKPTGNSQDELEPANT